MQGENGFACSSCCGNDVPRPILFFVAAKKNGSACSGYRTTRSAADSNFLCGNREWFRLQRLSRQRSSASDSILRSCKEEWPACRGRRGNDLPRPILIFFAATENGFACSGSRDDELPRPNLIFVAAKKNGSACSSSTKTAIIEVEIGQLLQ